MESLNTEESTLAITNYHSIGGEMIGETTTGSPRVDYLTDALGSVTATVNQSAQVVNTYRYNPFGSLLAKSGTGPDPAFGWIGGQGYRPTGNKFSDFYVRRRHPDSTAGRWPTQDPIGLHGGDLNYYKYAGNCPVTSVDPSGLFECWQCPIAGLLLPGLQLWCLFRCHWGHHECVPPPPPPDAIGPYYGAIYGQYCGPQTDKGEGDGVDELDACCRVHDECFANADPQCNAFNQWRWPACKACNRDLCACAGKASCDMWSGTRKAWCLIARKTTMRYACWRPISG